MKRPSLRLVGAEAPAVPCPIAAVRAIAPPEGEGALLLMMESRRQLAAMVAALDERIAAEARAWSFDRGYRVPLRPEQIEHEIRRHAPGAGTPAATVADEAAPAAGGLAPGRHGRRWPERSA